MISTRNHPNSLLLSMALGLVMFLAYTYFILCHEADSSGVTSLLFLMLIQITPAILTFGQRRFNFISFVMLNHFVVYSLAKYNQTTNLLRSAVLSASAQVAIREMIYCSILIIGSYIFTKLLFTRRKWNPKDFHLLTLTKRQYFWLGFYAFSQPFVWVYLPTSFYVLHLLSSYAAIVLVFCGKTNHPAFDRFVKTTIILAGFYDFVSYATLSMLGSLGILFFVVSFIQWRWSNFIGLAMLLLAGITIQTVKADYRIISLETSPSTIQRVALLGNLLWVKFTSDRNSPLLRAEAQEEQNASDSDEEDGRPDEELGDTFAKGFARIGDDSLERVLMMTPSRVPFWNGETYEHLPYIFIPRVLWPNKPSRSMWNKFGRVYGYLSADDFGTSVGINFLGEAYMNFGYLGLYTVAMLFGTLIALVESACYLFLPQQTFFAFICFMLPFLNYGLDLCSIINGIVLVFCVMYFIRYRLVQAIQRDVYC